jgi:hypothetical protein
VLHVRSNCYDLCTTRLKRRLPWSGPLPDLGPYESSRTELSDKSYRMYSIAHNSIRNMMQQPPGWIWYWKRCSIDGLSRRLSRKEPARALSADRSWTNPIKKCHSHDDSAMRARRLDTHTERIIYHTILIPSPVKLGRLPLSCLRPARSNTNSRDYGFTYLARFIDQSALSGAAS